MADMRRSLATQKPTVNAADLTKLDDFRDKNLRHFTLLELLFYRLKDFFEFQGGGDFLGGPKDCIILVFFLVSVSGRSYGQKHVFSDMLVAYFLHGLIII